MPHFHDDRTSSIARWLPDAEDMLDGGEPHEKPRVMDSWYLLHPMLNLARLAARGDDGARELLLRSLDREIEVAQHFRYEWPVFYDVDTLEVIKAESEPGKGGELDVPGLYAHVMLQAFDLTDDDRYLHEAIAAARTLHGKGFELAYQMNNVAFGMVALLRLFQVTGESDMRDMSRVLSACLFDNVGLWSTRYGKARDRGFVLRCVPHAEDVVHRRLRAGRGIGSVPRVPVASRRRAATGAQGLVARADPTRHREARHVLPAESRSRRTRRVAEDGTSRT